MQTLLQDLSKEIGLDLNKGSIKTLRQGEHGVKISRLRYREGNLLRLEDVVKLSQGTEHVDIADIQMLAKWGSTDDTFRLDFAEIREVPARGNAQQLQHQVYLPPTNLPLSRYLVQGPSVIPLDDIYYSPRSMSYSWVGIGPHIDFQNRYKAGLITRDKEVGGKGYAVSITPFYSPAISFSKFGPDGHRITVLTDTEDGLKFVDMYVSSEDPQEQWNDRLDPRCLPQIVEEYLQQEEVRIGAISPEGVLEFLTGKAKGMIVLVAGVQYVDETRNVTFNDTRYYDTYVAGDMQRIIDDRQETMESSTGRVFKVRSDFPTMCASALERLASAKNRMRMTATSAIVEGHTSGFMHEVGTIGTHLWDERTLYMTKSFGER